MHRARHCRGAASERCVCPAAWTAELARIPDWRSEQPRRGPSRCSLGPPGAARYISDHSSEPSMTRALALPLALLILAGCTARHSSSTVAAASSVDRKALLLDPGNVEWTRPAPPVAHVRFETSKGVFVLRLVREWGPMVD